MCVCGSLFPAGVCIQPAFPCESVPLLAWVWFVVLIFFEILSRNSKFHENLTRITSNLREEPSTFMIISCSFLLRKRHVLNKSCRENQNKHFYIFNKMSENIAIYEIMWKNIIKLDRPQVTIQYGVEKMRLSCRSRNIRYTLLYHGKTIYANAPPYHVARTVPVLSAYYP
jgi:bisphosphoglycerate-dependent phosphoglycerate mutase